jgi:hypothetical protein
MSLADPKLVGLADTDDVALEFHPLADLFPMMAPADQMALGDDIAERGLRDPARFPQGERR